MRTDLGLRPSVAELTDVQLVRAWRISFAVLQDVRTAMARERVVALRQAYLDEMERRDPAAFGAWLESGAGAAGAPDNFVAGPPGDHHHKSG